MLLDDFSRPDELSALNTRWLSLSDRVMGGVSVESVDRGVVFGRQALRLRGRVRLENGGGFLQAALPLAPEGGALDARDYSGVRLVVRGNGRRYHLHLRTSSCLLPWQHYRAPFEAAPEWHEVQVGFDAFAGSSIGQPLDRSALTRLGIVASGEEFDADIAVADLRLQVDRAEPR